MRLARNVKTVTNGDWGVSCETGSCFKGAILKVYKLHSNMRNSFGGFGRFQYGDANGKVFANSDEAFAYALDHGYLTPHFRPAETRARNVARGRMPWHNLNK